jgi:hypothetical protein
MVRRTPEYTSAIKFIDDIVVAINGRIRNSRGTFGWLQKTKYYGKKISPSDNQDRFEIRKRWGAFKPVRVAQVSVNWKREGIYPINRQFDISDQPYIDVGINFGKLSCPPLEDVAKSLWKMQYHFAAAFLIWGENSEREEQVFGKEARYSRSTAASDDWSWLADVSEYKNV